MSTAPKSASPFIDLLTVTAATIPTDFPESDGTLAWDKTTIVIVELRSGTVSGLGYTYADLSTAILIEKLLKKIIEGRDAMDISGAWNTMVHAIRNLGRPGVSSMAISAVDIALWDLKAKLLHLPLVKLLGATRDAIPVYGSGGFTSYSDDQIQKQLGEWVESGINMVKMKVGRAPQRDPERVRRAREAVGKDAGLFVDANGAYSCKQALSLAQSFQESNVSWFEEPVSSDDLDGLCFIRNHLPEGMAVAAGEYGYDSLYFRRMLDAGAVDVLQADATRCGGITGFLQTDVLCGAWHLPLSAHTAPALHLHACCAASKAIHLEYFHDHVRIESLIFDGTLRPQEGSLVPDTSRFGLGLELRRADLARYPAG
jgi:L-alanine-DL-glutamate epimerase-like enolase superfamily enzyme